MPMCIISLDMRILDLNASFAELIELTPENATELSCTILSPVHDYHKLFAVMQK